MIKKFVFKDYKNQLEDILEKKKFDENVKNTLLSMLYKIENAYPDYNVAKREVCLKSEYIEKILEIIQKKCRQINIANPGTEFVEQLKENKVNYIIEEDMNFYKTITVYPNEQMILNAIFESDKEDFDPSIYKELTPEQKGLIDLVNLGYIMDKAEVIRDFDGWSWNIPIKEINDLKANVIYTNFIFLVGEKFIAQNVKAKEDGLDPIRKRIEKIYGKEITDKYFHKLTQFLIVWFSNHSEKEKESLIAQVKENEEELGKMTNKTEYLNDITKLKKEKNKDIGEIDSILNNSEMLKKEYIKYNSKLQNKDKIFSVSHYEEKLQKHREKLLEEIKEYNQLLDPRSFVKQKTKLEEKNVYLKELNVKESEESDLIPLVIDLQKYFMDCFNILIKKCVERKDILNLIYELRYYSLLPVLSSKYMKSIEELKESLDKIHKEAIKKAIALKVLEPISHNDTINELILKSIFNNRVIKMEEVFIELYHDKENSNITIEFYDQDVLEYKDSVEINEMQQAMLSDVKFGKKIRLFI